MMQSYDPFDDAPLSTVVTPDNSATATTRARSLINISPVKAPAQGFSSDPFGDGEAGAIQPDGFARLAPPTNPSTTRAPRRVFDDDYILKSAKDRFNIDAGEFAKTDDFVRRSIIKDAATRYAQQDGIKPELLEKTKFWAETVTPYYVTGGSKIATPKAPVVRLSPFDDAYTTDKSSVAQDLSRFREMLKDIGGDKAVAEFAAKSADDRRSFVMNGTRIYLRKNNPSMSDDQIEDYIKSKANRIGYGFQVDSVFKQATSELAPKKAPSVLAPQAEDERGVLGEAGAKLGAGVLQGAAGLARGLEFVTSIDNSTVSDFLSQTADSFSEGDSQETKDAYAKLSKATDSNDWSGVAGVFYETPSLITNIAANSVGYVIGSGGVAGAGRALIAKAFGVAALKTGTAAAVAGVGGTALATGADTGKEAADYYTRMTDAQIKLMPDYQERLAELGDSADVDDVRTALATTAQNIGFAGGVAAGIVGGVISRPIARVVGLGGLGALQGKTIARTALAEGASEFVEEAGQAAVGQIATGRDVLANGTLIKGTIGAALGGVAGAGLTKLANTGDTSPPTKPFPETYDYPDKGVDDALSAAHDAGVEAAVQSKAERDASRPLKAAQVRQAVKAAGFDNGNMPDVDLDALGLTQDTDVLVKPSKSIAADVDAKGDSISEAIANMARLSQAREVVPDLIFGPDDPVPNTSMGLAKLVSSKLKTQLGAYNATLFNPVAASQAQAVKTYLTQGVVPLDETAATQLTAMLVGKDRSAMRTALNEAVDANPALEPAARNMAAELDRYEGLSSLLEQSNSYAYRNPNVKRTLSSEASNKEVYRIMQASNALLQAPSPVPTPQQKNVLRAHPLADAVETSPFTGVVRQGIERVTGTTALDRSPRVGRMLAWRNTETKNDLPGVFISLAKAGGRFLYDTLDTLSEFRVLDNEAHLKDSTFSRDSGVHASAMSGQNRSAHHLDRNSTAALPLLRVVTEGAAKAGLPTDAFRERVGELMFYVHGQERIRARWAFENYSALTPTGKAEYKKLITEIETAQDFTTGDATRVRASLNALYSDAKTANLNEVIPLDKFRLSLPGKRAVQDGTLQDYAKWEEQAREYFAVTVDGNFADTLLQTARHLNSTMNAAMGESRIAARPTRNLIKVYGFKDYAPMQEENSAIDKSLFSDDIDANFINLRYRAMKLAGAKDKDNPYAQMSAKDPIKRLVGMAAHAAHHVADNRITEALVRTFDILDRPQIGSRVRANREYDAATGSFGFNLKMPDIGTSEKVIHRNDDGSVDILTILESRLTDTLSSRRVKQEDVGLVGKVARGATRTIARTLTLDPRFILSAAIPRDAMEAFFVTADTAGYRAATKAFANNAKLLMKAPGLHSFYAADADGKQSMLAGMKKDPLLKYTAMRYELFGATGYRASLSTTNFDPAITDTDPLRRGLAARVTDTVGKLISPLENVATTADNWLRDAAFKAMIDSGVAPKDAANKIQNIMNFGQRARIGSKAGNYYAFLNTSLVGLNTATTRRFWSGGEAPLRSYTDAAGNTIQQIDWAKAAQSVNWRMVGGSMALAMTSVLSAATFMDDDDFDKLPVYRFMQFVTLPNLWSEKGHPVGAAIPTQYGVQMVSNALGAAIALTLAGRHEASAIASSFAEVLMANGIPIGKFSPDAMMGDFDRAGLAGVLRNAASSASPSAVSPFVQLLVNRSGLGGVVFREERGTEDQFLAQSKNDFNLGTVKPFTDTPAFFETPANAVLGNKTGEFFNLDAPESWQHLLRSYGGFVGRSIIDIAKNTQRAAEDPEYGALDAAWQTLPIIARRTEDTKNYDRSKVNDFVSEQKRLESQKIAAREEDKSAARDKNFGTDTVGPKEAAWVEANPEWRESKIITDAAFVAIGELGDEITAERRSENPDFGVIHAYKQQINDHYKEAHTQLEAIYGED